MFDGTGCAVSVAIKSIGCRTNQEEMVALQFKLQQEGFRIVEQIDWADIIIVNTCSVTAFTEAKTRRLLNSISSDAPLARVLVTGCLAQQKPEELRNINAVQWVVGNTLKEQIVSILKNEEGGIFHSSFDAGVQDETEVDFLVPPLDRGGGFRTRFPLKIQEGCDFSCSYCIVPSLRGPSRSFKFSRIIETAKKAVGSGYKELVITGTHIGQFNGGLSALLDALLHIEGDFRIRLSSLDPRDLNDNLITLVETEQKICDHLHISVQSFSADVLQKMNRPTENLDIFIEKLIAFHQKNPCAALGCDLIVGFPGESEAHFNQTSEQVEKIGFTYAHVFRFSPRPGTAAAGFSHQIPEKTKSQRSLLIRELVDRTRGVFLEKTATTIQKIIVESEFPVRGITSNFIHVEVPQIQMVRNSWLEVAVSSQKKGRFFLAKPIFQKVK